MYAVAVLASAILMVMAAVDYIRRAWLRETKPVLATWILIMAMTSLSFWMYWANPQKSWTANIAVNVAFLNNILILTGVIAANIRYKTLAVAFDSTQKWCLAGGVGIVIFWFFSEQPLTSYILIQCIALFGYFATVKHLWCAKQSTEPLFVWIAIFLASLCALYPAWTKHDIFAWIFLGRVIPSTALVIYLIKRVQTREMRTPTKKEALTLSAIGKSVKP